jgi:hypothetical protein
VQFWKVEGLTCKIEKTKKMTWTRNGPFCNILDKKDLFANFLKMFKGLQKKKEDKKCNY